MIQQIPIEFIQKIEVICREFGIRELSLFGSRVRGDFTDNSDYDFLVEFLPDVKIDLFDFVEIKDALEKVVKADVDLVSKNGLKPRIKDRVLSEAKVIYAG